MKTPNPDQPIRNTLKHLALASALGAALYFGAAPASATPVTTGLALWLDASDATTMTIDGSGVAEWRDKNGSVAKMTRQAGAPTVVATGIGGIPTVSFNNSSRMNNGVNHAAPVTIFYVSRQTGGANQRVLGATSNNWLLGYWNGLKGSAFFDGNVLLGGNGPSDTAPHLYAATIGGSGQASTVWAEGVQIASNTNGTAGPNNLQLNGYQGGAELSNCEISEVLVYNGILDANDLLAVGGYLTAKYGLTTSYPTGLTVELTSPVNGSDYLVGATIPATASVISGTAPYTVDFLLDSGSGFVSQGTDSDSPYTVNLTGLAIGPYSIKATVTDGTAATDDSPTRTFTVSNAGPTNLAAVSSNQLVNLSWNQVLGATGYKVFRSSPNNSSYVEIATGITDLTYQSTGLTNGTPYFYVVRATVGATVSDPSNEVSSTPLAVDDSKATVAASAPYVLADGIATSTITVTLKDGGDAPAPDLNVTLASSRPLNDTVSAASGLSDANGVVTFTVKSSVVGTSEYTATVTDIPLTLTETATVGFADPAAPFGINVNLDSTVRTGLVGPGGGLGAVWNTIATASATNLSLASGPPSTVGFTSSGTGSWFLGATANFDPDLDLLRHGWINFGANGTTQQLVITGLNPAKTYDLYIASAIVISGNQCSRGEWSTTNTTSTLGSQAVDNRLDENGSTWVRGNNYVLFEDVVPDGSNNITVNGFAITEQPTYDIRLPLNGFQLVENVATGGFDAWADANGATDQTPLQDHDNDGVKNGIEFFMGETGSSFTANPSLNASNEISWPASAAYQGTYEVQTSPDLATWTNVDPRPPIVSGFLTYELPAGAPGGESFVRLLVTPTP